MTTKTLPTWQEELAGGRTAWSATVTVAGQNMAARYWYDGQYVNNAKEDAAEVACTFIRSPSVPLTVAREGEDD